MITLNDYVLSLFTAVYRLGSMVGIAPKNLQPPLAFFLPDTLQIHSVEFTIPMLIDGMVTPPQVPRSQETIKGLEQRIREELALLMELDKLPKSALQRLQAAISEGGKKAQSLLRQEEVAVDRVLLDYAQSVLAVIWDAFPGQEGQQNGDSWTSFDQLTEQLKTRLIIWWRRSHAQPHSDIHITYESQKLRDFPSHALTYMKLCIVG
jgi:hypothetical protein